jgi:hypothetical protein
MEDRGGKEAWRAITGGAWVPMEESGGKEVWHTTDLLFHACVHTCLEAVLAGAHGREVGFGL